MKTQQVGPIYFKTPRKAHLFGVCCEAIPFQVNYLIDEADIVGKGSNSVISLLDHYFETHGLGETHALLTADNCAGQNKNNMVLQYLQYRTMMGLHKKIDFSFMLPGHTKFAPDGYFGLIKMKYRRSKVYTYEQMAEVINASTPGRYNKCQMYKDENGKVNFQYRDWSNWLSKHFKKFPDISKFHHFSFSQENPGVVIAKKSVNGERVTFQLLNNSDFRFDQSNPPKKPKIIISEGLTAERQWQLYNTIREHIPAKSDKNATCPLPNVPNPKIKHSP